MGQLATVNAFLPTVLVLPRIRRFWRFWCFVYRRFDRDGGLRAAGALSYTSLLSLVPLMAIALAILAAFPVFDQIRADIQSLVFRSFVPEVGSAVEEFVSTFVSNTGRLTGFGIAGLAVTAILLIVTIEQALNEVFRVEQQRSAFSRLLVYWTALTLGPLLVGASFSLQGYLPDVMTLLPEGAPFLLRRVIPFLMTALAFSIMYATVPNRPIRPLDAALGGLAGAILFALLRLGFSYYIAASNAYSTVYGAVAVIPIFLLWMYLSWAIVLFGAEVAAALPEWRAGGEGTPSAAAAGGQRKLGLALDALAVLWRAAQKGDPGVSRSEMLSATTANERVLQQVMEQLRETGFVVLSERKRYVLSRDLTEVTLHDLVESLQLGLAAELQACPTHWQTVVGDRLDIAAQAERANLEIPLKDIVAAVERSGDDKRRRQAMPALTRGS
jgi:membrane protein